MSGHEAWGVKTSGRRIPGPGDGEAVIVSRESNRRIVAGREFSRSIVYLVVAGVALVGAALVYLSSYGPLTVNLVIATSAGVFVSVVLGGGLMAAGFFSSTSGVDDEVAAAGEQPRP